jgi:hypothetical protein
MGVIQDIMTEIERIKAAKQEMATVMTEKGVTVPSEALIDEYPPLADTIEPMPDTFILQDENGVEVVATAVSEEMVFDATENDIREGKTAATLNGVTVGTKVIPSYHTREGYRIITTNSQFAITQLEDLYDYSKLQAIICPYNNSIVESVAADKVAINEGVYAVNSTGLLATVTKDSETKSINLGITNESENLYVLRYFTYKEIY